jgi:hypothetical protein
MYSIVRYLPRHSPRACFLPLFTWHSSYGLVRHRDMSSASNPPPPPPPPPPPGANAGGQAGSVLPAGQSGESQPAKQITPIMRSVLQLCTQVVGVSAMGLKTIPGVHSGIIYKAKPFGYSCGYRDAARGIDYEDKGNHLKLRDPMGLHYLTIPITAQLVWNMNKLGVLDVEKPLTDYVPELPKDTFSRLTARELLSYTVGIDDNAVFKDLGLKVPPAMNFGLTPLAQQHEDQLWTPLRKHFGEAQGLTPMECRNNVITYLKKNASNLPKVKRVENFFKVKPSLFGFVVLTAAIERIYNKPFEDVMQEKIFKEAYTASMGFGVPQVLAHTSQFFQPKGGSSGHYGWYAKPSIEFGNPKNAAPSIFNSCLNGYGVVEDISYLICCTCQLSVQAVKQFGAPSKTTPYFEFGVQVDPRKDVIKLLAQPTYGYCTPYSAAFHYHTETMYGGYAVGNCGSPRAKAIVNCATMLNELVLKKMVLDEGVDPDDEEVSQEVLDRIQKQADSNMFKKLFGKKHHSSM